MQLHLNISLLHVLLSSFNASLWPGDLSEPDGQHSHRAAETCPEQRRSCKVGLTEDKNIRKFFRHREKNIRWLWMSIPNSEEVLAGNSVPYCSRLIFGALFVCGLWSCEEEHPLKMRSQKPRATEADFSIPFLNTSFMLQAHPGRDSEERRHFPCLISRLWGKQVACIIAKLSGEDYHLASFIAAISVWQLAQAFPCISWLKSKQLSHFIKSSLHWGSNFTINFVYLLCPFVASFWSQSSVDIKKWFL